MGRVLLIVMLVFGFAAPLRATTYYVRKTGNDGNTGTAANQAWLTIQKAATTMVAGDRVYVGAGTYAEFVQPTNDGTAVNPIQFIADAAGTYTGDVGDVILNAGSGSSRSFEASGDDYVQLHNFRISGGNGSAVHWTGSVGGLLANCELFSSTSDGIVIRGNSSITLQNCWIHDNVDYGVEIIEGVTVTLLNLTVERNAKGGIAAYGNAANNTTANRCRVRNNPNQGLYLDNGTSSFKNLLVTNSGDDGIRIGSAGGTHTLWHCTSAYNASDGLQQLAGTVTVRNSIFADNTRQGLNLDGGTLTHTYNCVFGNTLANFSGTTQSTGEITSDPKFWSATCYELQDGSPCLNTGTNPGVAVTDDVEGLARPIGAGYDMGCYETKPVAYASLTDAYLQLNPYAWWKLNETSGSAAVDSIGSHHGAYTNGVILAAQGGPFYTNNKAANFDGVDDRVSVGNINPAVSTMSFIGWFRADDFDVSNADVIAKSTGTADANYFWSLGTASSGGQQRLKFRFRAGGSTATVTASSGGLSTGAWVFVAGVYDGSALILYKDGAEVGRVSKVGTPDLSAAAGSALGDNPTGTRPFDGLLDEFAIFTKALSPREIAAVYSSALKGTFTGTVTIPKLWGIDEDDSNLFATTNYTALSGGNTTTYGRLKWNNSGVITNVPTTVQAMAIDRFGKAYFVCNSALGGTAAPVLLSFNLAGASTTQNNVVSIIGHIPVTTTLTGLAIDPHDSQLYAFRQDGYLFAINSTDASLMTTFGQVSGLGEVVGSGQDMMFDPFGNLYVLDDTDDEIYRVNKSSGAILEVYNKNGISAGTVGGLVFDHLNNRFVVSVTDSDILAFAPLSLTGFNYVGGLGSLGLTDVQAIGFVPSEGIKGNTSGIRIIHWKEIK